MQHEMRRKDRALTKEQAITILEEGEYGVLATVGEDGIPYGVPLSYVYEDGVIYFHGATRGHKLDNLAKNPNVSFTVVGETHVLQELYSTAYKSAIAFGKFRVIEESGKVEALLKLARKYCYDFLDKAQDYAEKSLGHVGVYALDVDYVTGKERPMA